MASQDRNGKVINKMARLLELATHHGADIEESRTAASMYCEMMVMYKFTPASNPVDFPEPETYYLHD